MELFRVVVMGMDDQSVPFFISKTRFWAGEILG